MSNIMTFTLVNHRNYFYYSLITKKSNCERYCEKDFISKLIEFLYNHMS